MKNQSIKQYVIAVVIGLGLVVGVASVEATGTWSQPCGTPPTCNADAPVNVGSNTQSKAGQLFVNTGTPAPYAVGLQVFGQSIFDNSSAGTSAIQIKDGHQGAGKVLTSDASGNGTWQSATSSGSGSLGASAIGMTTLVPSLRLPTPTGNVQKINLLSTTGSAPYNILPASTTAVLLKGETNIDSGGCQSATVEMKANSDISPFWTIVSHSQISFNDNCYSGASGSSGYQIVPVSDIGNAINLNYVEDVSSGGFSFQDHLWITGYIVGGQLQIIPEGAATGATATLSSSVVTAGQQPATLSINGIGGLMYNYEYKVDSGAWTKSSYPNNGGDFTLKSLPVGNHTINYGVYSLYGDGTPFSGTTYVTGTPLTLTVASPVSTEGMACIAGPASSVSGGGHTVTYNVYGSASGGPSSSYQYQFIDVPQGPPYVVPTSPLVFPDVSNTTSDTFTYPSSSFPIADPVGVQAISGASVSTTTVSCSPAVL